MNSTIRFGGYDETLLSTKNPLTYYPTLSTDSWATNLADVKYGAKSVVTGKYTKAVVNPAYLYIRAPVEDFEMLAAVWKSNKDSSKISCTTGYCKYNGPCTDLDNLNSDL